MPTLETYTIRSSGLGDYTTTQAAFDADSGRNLVSEDVLISYILYDDGSDYACQNGGDQITGCTTDATRFRALIVLDSDTFGVGNKLGATLAGDSDDRAVIRLEEDYCHIHGGLHIESGYTGALNSQGIRVEGAGCIVNACYVTMDEAADGSFNRGIFMTSTSSSCRVTNCVVEGSNASTLGKGMNVGIEDDGSLNATVHCVVSKVNEGLAVGDGIKIDASDGIVFNCIAVDSGNDDFVVNPTATESYNVSSDATAAGTGSSTNQSATSVFRNYAADNYRAKKTGAAINAGTSASAFVDGPDGRYTDYSRVKHDNDGSGVEIGAYNVDTFVFGTPKLGPVNGGQVRVISGKDEADPTIFANLTGEDIVGKANTPINVIGTAVGSLEKEPERQTSPARLFASDFAAAILGPNIFPQYLAAEIDLQVVGVGHDVRMVGLEHDTVYQDSTLGVVIAE